MAYYDKLHNDYINSQQKNRRHKCVIPECNNDAIKSHTISKSFLQNSKNHDNNYYWLHKNALVGINNIFTFPTFCNDHDHKIFKKIDAYGNYNVEDTEHHFLLYYRCLANEFVRLSNKHNFMNTNNYATDGRNLMLSNHLGRFEKENVAWVEKGFNMLYKEYCIGEFGNLVTTVIELNEEIPVYIGQYFDMSHDFEMNPIEKSQYGISLSSFPQNKKTYIILSFRKEDLNIYKFISKKLEIMDAMQWKTHLISTLALTHCQNICFGNEYWELLGATNQGYRDAMEEIYKLSYSKDIIDIFVSIKELKKLHTESD